METTIEKNIFKRAEINKNALAQYGFRRGGRNDKRTQSGWSMVEMLGTLAIVGAIRGGNNQV